MLMKTNYTLSIAVVAISLLIAGCESYTKQTTSGKDYLSKYPTQMRSVESAELDQEVRELANIEPNLRFPARIGLVKLYDGKLANLTAAEVEEWQAAKERLGKSFGDFVPVSSIIAESVYKAPKNYSRQSETQEIMRKVRLAAARQHLDVVLLYEVFSSSKSDELASSVANLTIIGAYFIPSESIETTGYANALLLDVRTGYPYGTAAASVTKGGLASSYFQDQKRRNLSQRNHVAAALKLVPEVESMMRELMEKLADSDQTLEPIALADPSWFGNFLLVRC